MHIQRVIQELGYSSHETAVYLASLALGGATISDIAAHAHIPRTSVQTIVAVLRGKGLMNYFAKGRQRLWIAENPEQLMIRLKEREAGLKIILPELQSLRRDTGVKPTVKTLSGVGEIRLIMEDMLETKHHISAIVAWDEWITFFGREFLDEFAERRATQFLKIRLLTPRTELSRILKQADQKELRHTRFIPAETRITNSNFIYGNKTAIISLNTRRPVGILIEDQDINTTMMALFESLWKQSSEV